MSEHSVVRQRLQALDDAIEALRGWGTGESGGPIGVWSDRISVDARDYASMDDGEDGCWVGAAGLYRMLRDLRKQMEPFARHVEEQAMSMGPATWSRCHTGTPTDQCHD